MLGAGGSVDSPQTPPHPTCLTARNYLNTQYTVQISVGDTSFWTVPDSGSFELLVPSATCNECRCVDSASECCTEARVDSKQTYLGPTGELKQVKMTFGQGPVMGSITNDRVRLNELSTSNQSVVLINEHKVQGYCESSYDGVLGLGHRRYARESDQDTALLTTLGVESFSICFGRNNDEPGRLVIGGGLPRLSYFDIPVVGTRHWAVQMRGAAFGGSGGTSRVCDQPPHCGAIIDSGTSLLAGPRELVSQLLEGLGQAVAEDCSNVHELPNLTLRLGPEGGDQDFVLTPDVYITRTNELWQDAQDAPAAFLSAADLSSGSLGSRMGGRMVRARSTPPPITTAAPRGQRRPRLPHARASMSLLAQSETVSFAPVNASDSGAAGAPPPPKEYCSVVFMELGMTDQDYGPVWILGVPFMRAYSAQFKRGGGEGTDLVQQPRPETNSTEASPEARGAQPSVLVSEAERLDPSQPGQPIGPAAQAAGQPAQTAAQRVTGNHSGLFIGFAAIPAGHNPCAGCDAELPPARVTGRLASMHTHSLLAGSQGKRGGAAAPKRLPSVSLQHARLPSWAVLVKEPLPSVDAAPPQRIRHFL
jgi:hypothetical protein